MSSQGRPGLGSVITHSMKSNTSSTMRQPKCRRAGSRLAISSPSNARTIDSCSLSIFRSPHRGYWARSTSQNSIVKARSRTLSDSPMSGFVHVHRADDHQVARISYERGTPSNISPSRCRLRGAPVSMAESIGARYCSGLERFISSRTTVKGRPGAASAASRNSRNGVRTKESPCSGLTYPSKAVGSYQPG